MRKHFANQSDYNLRTNVFLIQPTDIKIKYRTNLAPDQWPEMPRSTQVIEMMPGLTFSLDEEVCKDFQYLSMFAAWHAGSIKKTSYLKYRPAYNIPI